MSDPCTPKHPQLIYLGLVAVVTLEVTISARYWTWFFFWIVLLSFLLCVVFMLAFPPVSLAAGFYDDGAWAAGQTYQVRHSPLQ